jgi:two-component system sensor histidine kinase AgrC
MLMTSILFVLHIFALLPYIVAAFAYTRIMKQKYALQREHDEQQNLQYHLEELEKQYTAIRKFKHDYQNILISMDVFFAKDDYTNLKQYYNQQIKPASEIITKDNFMLEALSRIKIPEVKSILAVKLLMAQNTNININTSFEAPDKIDSIPISSIALVRMLGIILDNAIEELTELSGGNLSVACFKDDENLTFIIQNTCRTNIPKLHELKQAGFSTKNKGCGLGLNILNEIEANHPNLTLSTTIAADIFTQKLTIRTEAKKMTLKE